MVHSVCDLLGAMVYADPLSGVWEKCSPNTTRPGGMGEPKIILIVYPPKIR
jgi:hypothetical protein